MPKTINQPIQIYQTETGALEIKVDQKQDTIWLTQKQITQIFKIDQSVVSRHISNIFKDSEVDQKRNMQKMHNAISDKPVSYYSLDVVLAVGYRTSSAKAIRFRKWATSILKDYLLKGYSINQKLLQTKREQITEIQETLNFLVKSGKNLKASDPFLEVLNRYTNSLITLNQFDENRIQTQNGSEGVKIEIAEFRELIAKTKQELIGKKEATELFGKEYEGKFESSISTIYQSFGGQELYPSLEEKSANLLYLIIKNHGFADGNKRIGSILFVYYLAKNNFLKRETGELKINDNTLVALALLIAQSRPEDKEVLIKLIIKLIQN